MLKEKLLFLAKKVWFAFVIRSTGLRQNQSSETDAALVISMMILHVKERTLNLLTRAWRYKQTTEMETGITVIIMNFTTFFPAYFRVIFSMFCIEQPKIYTKSQNLGATEHFVAEP